MIIGFLNFLKLVWFRTGFLTSRERTPSSVFLLVKRYGSLLSDIYLLRSYLCVVSLLLSEPPLYLDSLVLILTDLAFTFGSFRTVWAFVLEGSPGRSVFRVHRALTAPAPSDLTAKCLHSTHYWRG